MLGLLRVLGQGAAAQDSEGEAGGLDALLAAWLMSDGYRQTDISKLAHKHCSNAAVRAFAATEVKEHANLKKRLEDLGFRPTPAVGALASPERNTAPRRTAGSPNLATLKQELAERCATTQRQEMKLRRGLLFDKSYVCQQLFTHYEMLDAFTVFKRHASPKLAKALTAAEPTIETHIATLKKLILRLNGGSLTRSTRR
jgi:predicted outer membrane protein